MEKIFVSKRLLVLLVSVFMNSVTGTSVRFVLKSVERCPGPIRDIELNDLVISHDGPEMIASTVLEIAQDVQIGEVEAEAGFMSNNKFVKMFNIKRDVCSIIESHSYMVESMFSTFDMPVECTLHKGSYPGNITLPSPNMEREIPEGFSSILQMFKGMILAFKGKLVDSENKVHACMQVRGALIQNEHHLH